MTDQNGSVLKKVIRGKLWLFGDSLDTDGINPYYLYPDPDEMYKHTLETFRPEFPKGVKKGDIVVAGKNYGCGSSRPGTAVFQIGVAAVVVESLAPIMLRNTIGFAEPVFTAPGITDIVEDHQTIEIDYAGGVVRNIDTGKEIPVRKYPPIVERIYEAGGMLPYARKRYEAEMAEA